MNAVLLEVKDLDVQFAFRNNKGEHMCVYAINNLSMTLNKGEILGVVGESGCGKSTLARTILRMEEKTSGSILFKGRDISSYKRKKDLQRFRREAQMIFQNPYASLNQRKDIRALLRQPLRIHGIGNEEEREEKIVSMLEEVGFDSDILLRYPRQFSAGERQRIAIARGLIFHPDLLICDEVVNVLDSSIQAQIINLLLNFRESHKLTYLFIAHDLSLVEFIADRIMVMYLGSVVELMKKDSLHSNTLHPYTQALMAARPKANAQQRREGIRIPKGDVPILKTLPKGCYYAPRCPFATKQCYEAKPPLKEVEPGHFVACWLQ